MAKFKKSARKTTRGAKAQAAPSARSLSESAQQIWLAGMGAFGRAQAEGGKLFEALVREGMNFEQHARRFAGGHAEVVRDAVEARVGQARERATDTWDRLEKVFEDRVQRALTKLGVPGREELADLSRQVEGLTRELRRQGGTARKPATAKAPARRTAKKKTASAKKAAPAKAVKRPARKRKAG